LIIAFLGLPQHPGADFFAASLDIPGGQPVSSIDSGSGMHRLRDVAWRMPIAIAAVSEATIED
jgi:hypothetical protein